MNKKLRFCFVFFVIMMKKNVLIDRSFAFAVRIVKLYQHLLDKKEFVLSKQMLRSGTSIGANIREAQNAESKNDFIHKLAISQKECEETMYWLELLQETNFLTKYEFDAINKDAQEILKMLRSAILTAKNKTRNK